MNGKIYFTSMAELAEFLRLFSGCTATFNVERGTGHWVLTFIGGY